jgi:RNA polymerase sigma-70 factor, ECF subfamily
VIIEKSIGDLLKEESIIRNAQNDPAHFKPLYEAYFKRIFRFVFHRVGEKDLAADLTSQVFLKALVNLKKFEFRGVPFSAWLFRIALNECNELFRKTKRHRYIAIDDADVMRLYEEMVGDFEPQSLFELLPVVLESLSQDELHLIELRFFEQRPFKEVAEILNITENYAKVKVYRVLDKMKVLFTGRKNRR